jgi:hypothetical protein
MSESNYVDISGRYGVISMGNEATAVCIYDDEQIEEKLDAPALVFPDESESMSQKEILRRKVGAMHTFFEEVGKMAVNLFKPVEDELEGIVIVGKSPMKYQFDEGRYLGELHDMAFVKHAGPMQEHPLAEHVDDDKTIAEQLNS